MSMLDRAIAAISPPVTDEKRAEAHAKARDAAEPGDWLCLVLDHHEGIDAAFAAVKAAATVEDRRKAENMLGTLLTGHSMAEEAVIYPALAQAGEQGHANTAYSDSPKSHRLNFLRSQAEQLEPSLALAWPRQSKFEQRCFELLRRAYIDARYSPHFRISEEELNWLAARTESLRTAVESICEARLADLRGPA